MWVGWGGCFGSGWGGGSRESRATRWGVCGVMRRGGRCVCVRGVGSFPFALLKEGLGSAFFGLDVFLESPGLLLVVVVCD